MGFKSSSHSWDRFRNSYAVSSHRLFGWYAVISSVLSIFGYKPGATLCTLVVNSKFVQTSYLWATWPMTVKCTWVVLSHCVPREAYLQRNQPWKMLNPLESIHVPTPTHNALSTHEWLAEQTICKWSTKLQITIIVLEQQFLLFYL